MIKIDGVPVRMVPVTPTDDMLGDGAAWRAPRNQFQAMLAAAPTAGDEVVREMVKAFDSAMKALLIRTGGSYESGSAMDRWAKARARVEVSDA